MGNTVSTTPYGAQSNLVNVGLQCQYGFDSSDIFNATVSWTSPLTGNNIYYSSAEASISVPDSFLAFGATSDITASVNITIELENSSPGSVVLSQTVTQNGADKVFKFSFGRQGPFAIPAYEYSRATVGQVDFKWDFPNEPVYGTCQPTRALISTVQGRDETNEFADSAVSFPATRPGEKAVIVNPRTRCTGADEFKIRIEGVLPVNPSASFNITRVKSYITVPGNLVEAWTNPNRSFIGFQYNNANMGGFPGLQIVDSGTRLTKDWSREFVASIEQLRPLAGVRYLNGVSKSEVTIEVPTQDTITVGEYAAQNGTFSLWFIGFAGLAAGYDANTDVNREVGKTTFRCEAAFGDLFSVYSA